MVAHNTIIIWIPDDRTAAHHPRVDRVTIYRMHDQSDYLLREDAPAQVFLRYAPDAVLLVAPTSGGVATWSIIASNERACLLYGYQPEELAGQTLHMLQADASEQILIDDFQARLWNQDARRVECLHRRQDGTQLAVELAWVPDDDADFLFVTVHDVTHHWQTERRQAAEHAVSRVLAEAGHFDEAAPRMLQIIGEQLDWELGALWCVDRDTNVLRCTATWQAAATAGADFATASRQTTFALGVGLPGQVWAASEPLWVSDIRLASNFPRHMIAAAAGLRSGFAFPIKSSATCFGVMEFFGRETRPPDRALLDMAATIGHQSGQFIERRRAEKAARAGEARNAAILHAALDAIITMDHTGRITEYNPAAEQILGFTREAAIGRDMAELIIPPSLREHHRRGLAHYLATGEGPIIGKRIELTALRVDKTEVPIELTVTRIPTDGLPLFTGFIRDLTARKQAEHAIRLQAQLLDNVEQAVIATDVNGAITYWNRWAETLYGWASAEVLGRDIVDVTPAPAMRAEASAIMDRLRAGESWSGELVLQRRDGTTFPAFVTDSPVYDAAGALVGIVGVSVDIAERKRREEGARFLAAASAVLSSSLDYTRTLTSLADLVVPHIAEWCAVDMVEADGSFRRLAVAHVDPAKVELAWELERRYGFDPNLPQGAAKVMRTGNPELYPEITDELLAYIATTDEHLGMLQRVGLRSGMIVPLTVRGQTLGAISLGSGASSRRFVPADLRLAEDLAERAAMAIEHARLYAEAQTATEEAQAAVRLRDQFLSIAAHELRTPVTSIHGYGQVLQMRATRDQDVSARDLRAIKVIVDQSERLSTLISTLLDVSRLEIGQFSLECQRVDLCAMGRQISEDVRLGLDQHTLTYTCPDMPIVIDGDALRLEQVVQNLLQNAIKYSPQGGPIRLSISHQDEQAVLSVTDCGVGIPQDAQANLFQRFYRASNAATSNISGMGIGLYVVNEIVARHGGAIEVDSVEGQGSTFTVRLPLTSAAR